MLTRGSKKISSRDSSGILGSNLGTLVRSRKVLQLPSWVSQWLLLALSTACQGIVEYGQGVACSPSDPCRLPLVCANGQCELPNDSGSGGSGPRSTATGGVSPSTGGTAPSTGGTRAVSSCTPVSPIKKLEFNWLGRSCGVAEPPDVVFTLNEAEVARVPLIDSCDCAPGIGSVEVTDLALLALGVNGVNTFRVTTTGELSWATVVVDTPGLGGEFAIWAAWPSGQWNEAVAHPENLCAVGVQSRLDLSGLAMDLASSASCN